MLGHIVPEIVPALKTYKKSHFFKDLKAGVLVGIVALPLAIALSIASGLGPREGIITSVIAGLVAAVAGGSKFQVSGVTGAFTLVISGLLASHGFSALLAATFLAGVLLILMGIFKAGALVKYIPGSVVAGFTMGIAFIIFLSQMKDFLGLDIVLPRGSINKLKAVVSGISSVRISSLIVGVSALTMIFIVEKINRKLPAMFIALIVCTLLNFFVGAPTLGELHGSGNLSLTADFSFFGAIQTSIIAPAISIALLSAISALLSAVVTDEIRGVRHNPHSELVGQGLSNIFSPIFGGIPSTGAVARASENARAGAVSPLSAVIHCAVMALWGFVFMGLAAYIPMSAFAAILFVVCKNMVDFKRLRLIFRVSLKDALLLCTAFLMTVFSDLVLGIVLTSAAAALTEVVADKLLRRRTDICSKDGIAVVKGRLSYLTVKQLHKNLPLSSLDISGVTDIDSDALVLLHKKHSMGHIEKIHCPDPKLTKKLHCTARLYRGYTPSV